jgi:hypothetical protein
MSSKFVGGLFAASLVLLAGTVAASAADLSVGRGYSSSGAIGTRTHTLGFWGENFPYGYRWSLVRACQRRVQVETPRGLRWRTVWVCQTPRRLAYR